MAKKRGHRPQRTCLGCGRSDDQGKLVRVVMKSDGELEIDRLDGRGGYLHAARDCWQAFLKRRSHYRAFRAEIAKDAKEKLVNELSERHWE
ncbi:MAG: YlxR family protein [Candidatus Binatia bacterium]